MYALYASAWPKALAEQTSARDRAEGLVRYDARLAAEASSSGGRRRLDPHADRQAPEFTAVRAECAACAA